MDKYILWAVVIGGLSAASLPLGAAVGLAFRPGKRLTGVAAAFGAGALIAALSVELVAPTVAHLHEPGHALEFYLLLPGLAIGGILFVVLDQIVNANGGFLRKSATTIAYFTTRRRERNHRLLHGLGKIALLRTVPPEQVRALVDLVQPVTYEPGEVIFREGEPGHCLLFIQDGEVALSKGEGYFKSLSAGDVLGEIALLTGAPRTAGATATERVRALVLGKPDFDKLRLHCSELDSVARELASERLDELRSHQASLVEEEDRWARQAIKALHTGARVPTADEIRQIGEEHSGAPLAIWLGILLDGIPESLVIGAGFAGLLAQRIAATGQASFAGSVPYALIAGLFLSNFPEAMSSSVGMRVQGRSPPTILLMWTSLMVITAAGAGLGYVVGESLPEAVVVCVEGVAAGAMLTMIASTMIPEAVHLVAAPAVGFSTLLGFLAAVAFKVFE
ncbi:MAG: cyclic nucleotide-binding domain-containing protein [Lentisphaerae bacterium]|jgi:CRP-like cAMP-binding protein|nr:cyclic nucleotide-binding domain-containing protein [Lentisphaerota bacterium]MBT4817186.1 cyclic nucleotide-binding domain-containing protein [Lentisphaerota bacterium]MBT5609400.1 cyclic nucleotide-binding domain-containing protein [Lentisphaerota bacterium]MBT7060223.1 cyclic nucleotide-binding domain-containing protein [Lentisphaerota bacterium]MBT7841708.1 cyclic nucleotide-binding domain-containing protein [Lentisphaerota bacterium]